MAATATVTEVQPNTISSVSEAANPTVAKMCLAECVGTFVLVLFGCGAVHTAVLMGAQNGIWQVAIVWGVSIMLAIYMVGAISGAHINPAVTIAFAVSGRLPWRLVGPYIAGQVGGAFLAAAALFVLFGPYLKALEQEKQVVRGQPGSEITAMCYGEYFPNPGSLASAPGPYSTEAHKRLNALVSEPVAFFAEALGTMFLALVIFAVTDDRNRGAPPTGSAPVFIGLTVAGLISFIAPLTQACFNPARDFGPRLFAYFAGWGSIALPGPRGLGFITVYILAPIVGAVLGAIFYTRLLRHRSTEAAGQESKSMKLISFCVAVALALPLNSTLSAELDPDMPYTAEKSNPISYDVDFSVIVTPPYHAKVLKVWLPLPQTDFGQDVSEGRLSTFPMKVAPRIGTEKVFGNKFACFEFHEPQGAQIIRHRFKIKVWELRWNVDAEKVVQVTDWPGSFDRYRRGETQAVVVDDRFTKLLAQILPQRGNPLHDFSEVMNWVIRDFDYDHVDASLQASSVHAFTKRCGHCSDYHGFCASMGRVLGYPTRMTYGLAAFPKNSPSHCKMEIFLPPYGWVSFDVSETQKLIAAIRKAPDLEDVRKDQLVKAAMNRLVGGFRESSWFLQTKGSDYELEPPASRRVAVVRTAYVEADGEPLPEPDPANKEKREFSWMTVHQYTPDQPVTNPFKDFNSLDKSAH